MKLKEEQIHFLFKIGVVIKGVDGALEAVAGVALFFTSTAALRRLADLLTAGELREDPTDFVATHLVAFFHQISINTKHFASVYLLIYGLAKMGLAVGLLRGKLWFYPTTVRFRSPVNIGDFASWWVVAGVRAEKEPVKLAFSQTA